MVSTLTLSLCVLFKQGQATKPVPVSTSQVQVTIFAPPAPAHLKREASIDESKMRKNNLDSEASLQYHKILNVFGTCVRLDRPYHRCDDLWMAVGYIQYNSS
jgi:hypothetical protein